MLQSFIQMWWKRYKFFYFRWHDHIDTWHWRHLFLFAVVMALAEFHSIYCVAKWYITNLYNHFVLIQKMKYQHSISNALANFLSLPAIWSLFSIFTLHSSTSICSSTPLFLGKAMQCNPLFAQLAIINMLYRLLQWIRRKNIDLPCDTDSGPTALVSCPHD